MSKQSSTVLNDELPPVPRAYIPPDLTYETMSEMGRELFDLSREIAESGQPLLSEEEIEREIIRRRGGHIPDDDKQEVDVR